MSSAKADPTPSGPKTDAHAWRMFFNFEFDSDEDLFNPFLKNPQPHLGRHHTNKAGSNPGGVTEVHDLHVSLEDILTGVTKRVKVTRHRSTDKNVLQPEERVIDVEVKKGWKEGTKITFPGEGQGGHGSGDLTFVVKEKKHAHFRREGSNIIYTATIMLREVSVCACGTACPVLHPRSLH